MDLKIQMIFFCLIWTTIVTGKNIVMILVDDLDLILDGMVKKQLDIFFFFFSFENCY